MSSKEQGEVGILEKEDSVDTPRRWNVILLNDHYTTMEFVIEVLRDLFSKSEVQAHQIMLQVHENGRGIAGTYSLEIAETKLYLMHERARMQGYPLKGVLEPQGGSK